MNTEIKNEDGLICSHCNVLLELGKVQITYMKSTFPTELLHCLKCGEVYVSEELAITKMLEVEKTFEDK
jgi:hypothetical protein